MASASLRRDGGTLVFAGTLVRDAVPALWTEGRACDRWRAQARLAAVDRVDSAGLALLAELAEGRGDNVEVVGDPRGLAELRRAYRLSPSLSFAMT